MYRVVFIDLMCEQGYCPNSPKVLLETNDITIAYQKQREYAERYPWDKVIVQLAVPRIVWETIKD